MTLFISVINRISKLMYIVSGIALTSMMLITVIDVILRPLGKPLAGVFEVAGLLGAIIAAFAIPHTSLVRGHIYMEFLIERMPAGNKEVIQISTRIFNILLFVALAISLFEAGLKMRISGEVSMTLQLPVYPIACAVGLCCLMQCAVMVCDIIKIVRGNYE